MRRRPCCSTSKTARGTARYTPGDWLVQTRGARCSEAARSGLRARRSVHAAQRGMTGRCPGPAVLPRVRRLNGVGVEFAIRPMTAADAHAVATWRYPDEYSFYDADANPDD